MSRFQLAHIVAGFSKGKQSIIGSVIIAAIIEHFTVVLYMMRGSRRRLMKHLKLYRGSSTYSLA